MRTLLLAILALSPTLGCTDHTATSETSPQNLKTGGGKADDGATSNDTRHLTCQLEYEVFTPTYQTATAASIDTTYNKIFPTGGVTATDGTYTLYIVHNNAPGVQLPFNAVVYDPSGVQAAYVVLPDLTTTDYFNFELGAALAQPKTIDSTTYDHVRAYCAARAS
jgi:hypothetical protein